MSIKIIPTDQQAQQEKIKITTINEIPLLLNPTPKELYLNRVARFDKLMAQYDFCMDYLTFCAKIASVQAQLLKDDPIAIALVQTVIKADENDLAPLCAPNFPLPEKWIDYLYVILDSCDAINPMVDQVITELKQLTKSELMQLAALLRQGALEKVNPNYALFIWSALSTMFTQLAEQLPGKATATHGEGRLLCPVCQTPPVASIILSDKYSGARYLHCGLCETRWHVPRVKCTCCDNMKDIEYYSIDDERSPIKTECCSACQRYLKIFNTEHEPRIDVIADDLISLTLDFETEQQGFIKSGINYFLFSEKN